jgi:DNA replication protein DnaC
VRYQVAYLQLLYSTVDLVNLLEQEKAAGKAGKLAFGLMRMDLVILDELGYAARMEVWPSTPMTKT